MPGPVFLAGDTVQLRTVEEEDLSFLHEHIVDDRIWRPLGRSTPMNRMQEEEYFENVITDEDSVHLLVAHDEEPVGMVGLDPINWRDDTAHIGYWISPDHQQQGYATEAVSLVVTYGFEELGLHRIAANVFSTNTPSKRLLESIGFKEEGRLRETTVIEGQRRDTIKYGLLISDWSQ